ncbi:hypothetical protein L596_026269 [Steinernema carpocapsae]|uniref:Uncharacterized protein n=1 Tax=Steinernema carpocapsae TaxID=34508 RepID=A0A4V5ZY50_STECR|nr:hypothetical protein L596_026269 [Steinernema carpocapsae]
MASTGETSQSPAIPLIQLLQLFFYNVKRKYLSSRFREAQQAFPKLKNAKLRLVSYIIGRKDTKNPVRKTTRKAAKRAAKSLREAPVVERALTSKNTAEDSEDGSMEGKRRRKRKILDWTPSGPKECEEVPSNDEDDDDGDYEPEQDEEKESDGERHEPPVQPPTDGRPRRGRPSNAMLAARQARTASVVGVTPGRSNKPKVKFDALPLLQVAVDGTSDPEDYEEENNAAGGDDGLVHLKFDKETRTIDNYGCYLSQYGNIKKSANGLTGDPMECNQPPLAMKSWMSRYAIVPGQSVLAKIM